MSRIKDFVIGNSPEGFTDSKFSILCEKEPIVETYNIKAKALYIIYKNKDGKTVKLYPDDITEPYFEFTETNRRKLPIRRSHFGSTGIRRFNTTTDTSTSTTLLKILRRVKKLSLSNSTRSIISQNRIFMKVKI